MQSKYQLSERKASQIAIGVVAGIVTACGLLSLSGNRAEAKRVAPLSEIQGEASPEVLAISNQDKQAVAGKHTKTVSLMRELYRKGRVTTASDFRLAGEVMSHSAESDDLLLAHDLSIAALAMGEPSAGSLAADTEDLFLVSIGERPRFQLKSPSSASPLTPRHRQLVATGPRTLVPVSRPVTD